MELSNYMFILLCCVAVICRGIPSKGWEKGGGQQYEGEDHSNHGEKGDKGYISEHNQESGTKGHHDKEGHSGNYDENGGKKSSHHHDDGYHQSHEAGEKGSTDSEYAEEGSFSKGHSTKGKHSIHKLNESKKRTEFYDQDHDEAYAEKHGASEHDYGTAKGGHTKGGHYKKIHLKGEFGKAGDFENGKFFKESAGHKNAEGQEKYYANGEQYEKDAGNEGFKKYGY